MTNSDALPIHRGEIYWVDWNPSRGSEQAGRRPALVIQENPASSNPNYPLTIVVAVSTRGRSNVPSHILVQPSEQNGLSAPSYIKCEQIQTVSKSRLIALIGELEEGVLEKVEEALKRVLALT